MCVIEIVALCVSIAVLFVVIWWAGGWKKWDLESVQRIPTWLVLVPGGLIVMSLLGLALRGCNS